MTLNMLSAAFGKDHFSLSNFSKNSDPTYCETIEKKYQLQFTDIYNRSQEDSNWQEVADLWVSAANQNIQCAGPVWPWFKSYYLNKMP